MKKLLLTLLLLGLVQAGGLKEMYSIRINNSPDGTIEIKNNGQWKNIGSVTQPAQKTNPDGFTASKWSKVGTIAATAVNAIHIKTGHNRDNNRGIVLSILPRDSKSETAIHTNLEAGKSIFGGEYPALVGNPVYLIERQQEIPLPANYQPKIGDILLVKILRPDPYPTQVIFENKFDGKITIEYPGNKKLSAGKVLKPVLGVGRFPGTKYTETGRVRANHNGVIDISTSPRYQVGGFQIIPAIHGESPEMLKAKTSTQWMVVGPTDTGNPEPEYYNLFSGYILPRFSENDLIGTDWLEKISTRTLVQVKQKNKSGWHPMPTIIVDENKPLPESAETALLNVSEIRILFPVYSD